MREFLGNFPMLANIFARLLPRYHARASQFSRPREIEIRPTKLWEIKNWIKEKPFLKGKRNNIGTVPA